MTDLTGRAIGTLRLERRLTPAEVGSRDKGRGVWYACRCVRCGAASERVGCLLAGHARRPDFKGGCPCWSTFNYSPDAPCMALLLTARRRPATVAARFGVSVDQMYRAVAKYRRALALRAKGEAA